MAVEINGFFHGSLQVTPHKAFDTSPTPEKSSRKSWFLEHNNGTCEKSINDTGPTQPTIDNVNQKATSHLDKFQSCLGDPFWLRPKLHSVGQPRIPHRQKHHQDKHRWGPKLKKFFYHHDPPRHRQTETNPSILQSRAYLYLVSRAQKSNIRQSVVRTSGLLSHLIQHWEKIESI